MYINFNNFLLSNEIIRHEDEVLNSIMQIRFFPSKQPYADLSPKMTDNMKYVYCSAPTLRN